jgi:hypothetical protein
MKVEIRPVTKGTFVFGICNTEDAYFVICLFRFAIAFLKKASEK